MTHYNLAHKFIPMPQATKVPDAKAAVDKEWQKARDNSSMGPRKSPKQEGGNSWSTKRQTESPLCYIDGHMSPGECGVSSICIHSSKIGGCSQIAQNSKSECPDIWIRLPKPKWPKSWSSMEDPVVPLEGNIYGHPLAGLVWERQFEKILLQHGWDKVSNLECLFVHRQKGLFSSVYVDDIKLAGKKQNIDPMWKLLKEVDLGEPTSFLDHVYLVALKENVR